MIHRILVGTDTSPSADLAVAAAADLAKAHDAELVVLYVRPPLEAREVFDPRKAPDPDGYLEKVRRRFPDLRVRTRQAAGDPAQAICEVADEERVDTIVVGNRGTRDRTRGYLRSVPSAILRRAPSSVLIVDTRPAH